MTKRTNFIGWRWIQFYGHFPFPKLTKTKTKINFKKKKNRIKKIINMVTLAGKILEGDPIPVFDIFLIIIKYIHSTKGELYFFEIK